MAEPGAKRIVQRQGTSTVTLERVGRRGKYWEIEMTFRMDQTAAPTGNQNRHRSDAVADAMQSHRGWVFQNRSVLVDRGPASEEPAPAGPTPMGQSLDTPRPLIEPSSFETLLHNNQGVRLIYTFQGPDNLNNIQWVYHAPTSIQWIEVDYILKNRPLP